MKLLYHMVFICPVAMKLQMFNIKIYIISLHRKCTVIKLLNAHIESTRLKVKTVRNSQANSILG